MGGAVVSWLVRSSGLSGLGSSPGQGHCVVFVGKHSHGASLMVPIYTPGWREALVNLMPGGNPAVD